jgi:hypothetical protein
VDEMKNIIPTTALIILGLSSVAYSDDSYVATDGLLKVNKGVLKETWISPDADLTKYTKIMLAEGEFEFRDVKKGPRFSNSIRSHQSDFWVSDKDKARATEMISAVFGESVAKSKTFEIVDTAGPDVLEIRGGLIDIVSHVPPPRMGAGETYITKIATATVVLQAVDSTTGDVLVSASERSRIERPGRDMIGANNVEVNAEVKRWARRIATKLVKGLDDIHS